MGVYLVMLQRKTACGIVGNGGANPPTSTHAPLFSLSFPFIFPLLHHYFSFIFPLFFLSFSPLSFYGYKSSTNGCFR